MEPVYFLLAYLLLPQRCYNAVDWLHKYRSSTTRNRQSSGLDANPSDRRDAAPTNVLLMSRVEYTSWMFCSLTLTMLEFISFSLTLTLRNASVNIIRSLNTYTFDEIIIYSSIWSKREA